MSQSTELTPVPWDDPKTQLPSVEAKAVAQAHAVAEAVLTDETDADPLAIKNRAQAAMHRCEEKDWQEAKRAFAYVVICCEHRWVKDNPRQPTGVHSDGFQGGNQVPGATASRLQDAYDGAEDEDIRAAGDTAHTTGEIINRGHVRQQVESPADGVRRKAKAKAQGAKAKRAAATDDRHALMMETLEGTADRAHAAEAELAARDGSDDIHEDALEELALSNKNLIERNETLTATIADLREKLAAAEGQVAYWKEYSGKIEAALQRGDA